MIKTRITDLFGTKVPVIAGGLQWLATPEYVAAAAHAGIVGFMTAASISDIDKLRDEIRRCRDLCDGLPYGVNVSMLPKLVEGENTQKVFDVIAKEAVPFVETSGRNPEAFIEGLHDSGIKVIHKAPNVKFALKAQSIGVDAVSVVGAECGGHPGMDMIGTMVQGSMAGRQLEIPMVIGGGIGNGEQLVAALAMGADGVSIGTRFLVAEEIWAHQDYKEHLIAAKETDTSLVLQSLRNTLRALTNDTIAEVQKIEAETPGDLDALLPLVSGKVGRQAYETGDWTKGALSVGQSVTFADKIEPLASIVARIEDEANIALARLKSL
jgi:NADH:quinone reductase (non-electrogenic)